MPPDPIKHVVVLMLENHSFDQMLGGLKSILPDIDGVDPDTPGQNTDADGNVYSQQPTTEITVTNDPKHELENVLHQLENGNGNFVANYSREYPDTTPEERQEIMGYYPPDSLGPLHELAKNFTICDRWFSSVPGPTWTNRFFIHSGTSLGWVIMPQDMEDGIRHPGLYFGYDQDTIYDRLNEKGISWRIYRGDVPQSLVLSHQRTPRNAWHYARMSVFFHDARGPENDFPAYSFIEPCYYPPGQNDDHPPHSILLAEALLAHVYNALRSNESLWQSTLLVVVYDEHGGFYDHVIPPKAVRPDNHAVRSGEPDAGFAFDRLGIRVPALLVSPWTERTVIHEEFDHTSLLRYLSDKWSLSPLTERVTQAKSIAPFIRSEGQPRQDTPAFLEEPAELSVAAKQMLAAAAVEPLNPQQQALLIFSEYLEQEELHEPAGKAVRGVAMEAGPQAQVAAAKERIDLFLSQQRARVASE